MTYFPDNCVMVSVEGTDEPQCLTNIVDGSCRTLGYPIYYGFRSICIYGTFYNTSENIVVYSVDKWNGINVFCKECSLKDNNINLFCEDFEVCTISFWNFRIQGGKIKLRSIYIIFMNAILEDSLIESIQDLSKRNYNEIHFENSSMSCYENVLCGLYFINITATKIVFNSSYLHKFTLVISVGQLMMMIYDTYLITPNINVEAIIFEYLKIPAVIHFDNITMVRHRTHFIEREIHFKVKGYEESKDLHYSITFNLTNPHVIIRNCHFREIHLQIQSKRRYFEPVFFTLFLDRSSFVESTHVGDGGGLKVISEVQNSDMIVPLSRNYVILTPI